MIRIAQIGVGYWGPNLLRNCIRNKRADVRAVVDLSEERRDFVHSLYPAVHTGDSVERVLADPAIEAVVIATPAGTHLELVMQALQSGKHVLVEKPMATSSRDVAEIGCMALDKGLVAMVGHTFLFNPVVGYIKGLIDAGEVGEVRYIYTQRLNLGRIRSDVDALWNLGPHDVSIIQYLLNDPEPTRIVRQGMDFIQDGVEDVVFMNVAYPNKVVANIHVSWLDPTKVRKVTIVGSKKMIVYDDIADNKVAIYDKGIDKRAILGENMDFDQPNTLQFDYRSGDVLLPKVPGGEPLAREVDHFLDCIEKKTPCLTGPSHAEKVVRILEA